MLRELTSCTLVELQQPFFSTSTSSSPHTRPDSTNNVERIELNNLKAKDEVVLVVHGRSIRHSIISNPDAAFPQRWAVAVAGHFTGNLKTIYNPAYTRPSRLPVSRGEIVLMTLSKAAGIVPPLSE